MLKNNDPNYHSKGCFYASIGFFLLLVIIVVFSFIFEGDSFAKDFTSDDSEINVGMLRISFIVVLITGAIFLYNYVKDKK